MRLYSYWRSTTSYRVRIALHLKGIAFDTCAIDLVAGEQQTAGYNLVNPVGGVPALTLADGTVLTQSMAILRYLEPINPAPPLWPDHPLQSAKVEAAALVIATDVHPVNNLKVGKQLKSMGHTQDDVVTWMNHWMRTGLTAFQTLLPADTPFCFGDTPGLADVCLVPQLYNAHRRGTDMTGLTRLSEIEQHCLALPAFDNASPGNQPDAPSPVKSGRQL